MGKSNHLGIYRPETDNVKRYDDSVEVLQARPL
jgi:hypothetical protein